MRKWVIFLIVFSMLSYPVFAENIDCSNPGCTYPITKICDKTIISPTNEYQFITNNHICESFNGLTLSADNIIFDCKGNTISSARDGYFVLKITSSNVLIKNCKIECDINTVLMNGIESTGSNIIIQNTTIINCNNQITANDPINITTPITVQVVNATNHPIPNAKVNITSDLSSYVQKNYYGLTDSNGNITFNILTEIITQPSTSHVQTYKVFANKTGYNAFIPISLNKPATKITLTKISEVNNPPTLDSFSCKVSGQDKSCSSLSYGDEVTGLTISCSDTNMKNIVYSVKKDNIDLIAETIVTYSSNPQDIPLSLSAIRSHNYTFNISCVDNFDLVAKGSAINEIPSGHYEVSLNIPTTELNQYQSTTLSASLTCQYGDCGDVSLKLLNLTHLINSNKNNEFYTNELNPYICPDLTPPNICSFEWKLNASSLAPYSTSFIINATSSKGFYDESTINSIFVSNLPPTFNYLKCKIGQTNKDCSALKYGETVDYFNISCSDDRKVNSISYTINKNKISQESNTLQYIELIPSNLLIQSANYTFNFSCFDEQSSEVKASSALSVAYGNLSTHITIDHITPTKYTLFNVTTDVTCLNGDCGDVTLALDPIPKSNNFNPAFIIALLFIFTIIYSLTPSKSEKRIIAISSILILILIFSHSSSITGNYVKDAQSHLISTTKGDVPFYTLNTKNTIDKTDKSCLENMVKDSTCRYSWAINATGNAGDYDFFVIANNNYQTNQSNILTVSIQNIPNPPPTLSDLKCIVNSEEKVCSSLKYKDTISALKIVCSDTNMNSIFYNITENKKQKESHTLPYSITNIYNLNSPIELRSRNYTVNVSCIDAEQLTANSSNTIFIPPGKFNLTLKSPTNVNQKSFFNATINVTCKGGDCFNISLVLYHSNNIKLSTLKGSSPFYTINKNPINLSIKSCFEDLTSYCNYTWEINATGINSQSLVVNATNKISKNQSNTVLINILPNLAPKINPLKCIVNSQDKFCTSLIYKDTVTALKINCSDINIDKVFFNITENKKQIQSSTLNYLPSQIYLITPLLIRSRNYTINVSCIDTELLTNKSSVYISIPKGKFNLSITSTSSSSIQNKTFNITVNVTCRNGDCFNVSVFLTNKSNKISTIKGAKPFYTTNFNPINKTNLACLEDLTTSCKYSWKINATGNIKTHIISANATNGIQKNSSKDLSIAISQAPTPPPTPAPNSNTGGGSISVYPTPTITPSPTPTPKCTPEWNCGDWSICDNGYSTRICINTNDCPSDYPETRKVCSVETKEPVIENPSNINTKAITNKNEILALSGKFDNQDLSKINKLINETTSNLKIERSYFYNESTNKTYIKLKITPLFNMTNLSWYESIPGCIGEYLSEINFTNNNYQVIKDDPLIVWDFEKAELPIDLSYEVKKKISDDCFKLLTSFGIAKEIHYPAKKEDVFWAFLIVGLFFKLAIVNFKRKNNQKLWNIALSSCLGIIIPTYFLGILPILGIDYYMSLTIVISIFVGFVFVYFGNFDDNISQNVTNALNAKINNKETKPDIFKDDKIINKEDRKVKIINYETTENDTILSKENDEELETISKVSSEIDKLTNKKK